MNRRLMTILLCAFLVAAGAAWVVYRLVGKQIRGNAGKRTTYVVLAAQDLGIGTVLKATDLKLGEVVGTPPLGVLLKLESAVGRGVISPIYAGEVIAEKRLALEGSGGGLAATIPPGMRACAVKVNDVVGVAGFVVPGTHVDVLISGQASGGGDISGIRVKTLLQDIEVLSAGSNFQRDNEGKPVQVPVVNLLVTPEQAELLSLAGSHESHVQLVLRNPMDRQVTTTPGKALANLYGVETPSAPAPSAPRRLPSVVPARAVKADKPAPSPVVVIEVMNGAKRTEEKFELQGERP